MTDARDHDGKPPLPDGHQEVGHTDDGLVPGPAEASGPPNWESVRADLLREHGPGLERDLRAVRRARLTMRLTHELRRPAERFCRWVAEAEGVPKRRPRRRYRLSRREVLPEYRAAGHLLRAYVAGRVSVPKVCARVTKELAARPVAWTLRPEYRGPVTGGSGPGFVLEKGERATDAWRQLAELLAHGTTLRRFRVCAVATCEKLFYDASPRGDRGACSTKHKNLLATRAARQHHKTASRP